MALSNRERAAWMRSKGYTLKEIALRLRISYNTAKQYCSDAGEVKQRVTTERVMELLKDRSVDAVAKQLGISRQAVAYHRRKANAD